MATILLVDDSKTVLKCVQHMLVNAGHQVLPAGSGRQAIRMLESTRVDLVLTDLYMPPPDGFEILDTVRALSNPPPIIVMTSNLRAVEVFRGQPVLGPIATLAKPFTDEQLCEAVDQVLSGVPAASAA